MGSCLGFCLRACRAGFLFYRADDTASGSGIRLNGYRASGNTLTAISLALRASGHALGFRYNSFVYAPTWRAEAYDGRYKHESGIHRLSYRYLRRYLCCTFSSRRRSAPNIIMKFRAERGAGLIEILATVVLFVALTVGSYYFWSASFENTGPFTATSTSIFDVGVNVKNEALSLGDKFREKYYGNPDTDISTWKTYRNERYGFELKYPAEWEARYAFQNEETPLLELYNRRKPLPDIDHSDIKIFLVEHGRPKKTASILESYGRPGPIVFGDWDSWRSQKVLEAGPVVDVIYMANNKIEVVWVHLGSSNDELSAEAYLFPI